MMFLTAYGALVEDAKVTKGDFVRKRCPAVTFLFTVIKGVEVVLIVKVIVVKIIVIVLPHDQLVPGHVGLGSYRSLHPRCLPHAGAE
jgi:hypothetical protein